MSKPVLGYVKLRVKGGSANPSPPVGPALGSKGINIMEFCKQFNARTKDQQGEIVPVIITVYQDKSFDFIIKTSPTVVAIMKLAEIAKGSPESNRRKVASIVITSYSIHYTKLYEEGSNIGRDGSKFSC